MGKPIPCFFRQVDGPNPKLLDYLRFLIVGVGMAAFALSLDQSPLLLGPIAGIDQPRSS
jgi:hypothetical protein